MGVIKENFGYKWHFADDRSEQMERNNCVDAYHENSNDEIAGEKKKWECSWFRLKKYMTLDVNGICFVLRICEMLDEMKSF